MLQDQQDQHNDPVRPTLYLEIVAPSPDLMPLQQQLHAALGEPLSARPSSSLSAGSGTMRLLLLSPDGSVGEQLAEASGEPLPGAPGVLVFRLSATRGELFLVQRLGTDQEAFSLECLPMERAEAIEEQALLLPGVRRVVLLLADQDVPGACSIDGAVVAAEGGS